MTSKDIYKALNDVDAALIESAAPSTQANRAPWRRWAALAACLCLLLAVLAAFLWQGQPQPHPSGPAMDGGSVPPPGTTTTAPNNPIIYLDASCKTSDVVSGTAVKYTGSVPLSASEDPPAFRFEISGIVVVAKAVEELPDIYQTLSEYGSLYTYRYRVFKMEVLNPLQSGMAGTFYYALPESLKGDLTGYDALLISMVQMGKDYILLNTNTMQLTAFTGLFMDYQNEPELGNIIAYTDNVFDESLWQDESWLYGYQFAYHCLEAGKGNDRMLVYRGYTLDDSLAAMQRILDGWSPDRRQQTFNHYTFQSLAAQAAMALVQPFENGVFIPSRYYQKLKYCRYIGGCPTNEWVQIDLETEAVTQSQYRFSDSDFENLPDIAAYIQALDLEGFTPQHTDAEGKRLLHNSAMGWYEKTANGVYAIVKIAWRYAEQDFSAQYYDETFLLLEAGGVRIVTRDELIALIGYNQNISGYDYGAAYPVPWE